MISFRSLRHFMAVAARTVTRMKTINRSERARPVGLVTAWSRLELAGAIPADCLFIGDTMNIIKMECYVCASIDTLKVQKVRCFKTWEPLGKKFVCLDCIKIIGMTNENFARENK